MLIGKFATVHKAMDSDEFPELSRRSLKRINRARYKAREGSLNPPSLILDLNIIVK